MQISQSLQNWFTEYEKYHRHPANKITHYLGIPLILLSAYGMLSKVSLFEYTGQIIDLGIPFLIAITVWSMSLDFRFGFIFGLVNVPHYLVGRELSLLVNVVVFLIGWVFQLVGHYKYEKKSPAFFKNLTQTLIGPMWILARVLGATKKA